MFSIEMNYSKIKVQGIENQKKINNLGLELTKDNYLCISGMWYIPGQSDSSVICFKLEEISNSINKEFLESLFKTDNTINIELFNHELFNYHDSNLVDRFVKILSKLKLYNYDDGKYRFHYKEIKNILLNKKVDYTEDKFYLLDYLEKYFETEPEYEEEIKQKPLYISSLENFNSHRWVSFYETEEGNANVKFAEGCHYYNLSEFEDSVEEKYGENKTGMVYRTYMLEAEKIRLALNMPPREIKEKIILLTSIKDVLDNKKDIIEKYIEEQKGNYYYPKNKMWFSLASLKDSRFKYLRSFRCDDENNYYYDLIVVEHEIEDNIYNIAIPVPILAEATGIEEQVLYNLFTEHLDRDEEEWI